MGKLKYFLGIEVVKNEQGICLSQRKYRLELLTEFWMLACKPSKKLVGKLIYLTITRPDISYVVHKLSQVMHAPKLVDMKSAFKVTAYVDSDWAKCTATRKSIIGYAVYLGDCLVSWKSKRRTLLAKSSAEAEYKAISSVACKIIWILKILTGLKVSYNTPIDMFCDNGSVMQIAANPVFHERTKQFEIYLFFLREKIAGRIFKPIKFKFENNVSDLFTKRLPVQDQKRFCYQLHLVDHF
uniref:Ribonuclease H-like domain-containing protein n=1 Tax=Tanacetum cinerariifolium TaxID=118510 RepID=A0A699I4R2_TANCI|nr:ribonuclease H-like domain-containing protein [Tanacetum cinerariifolium]